MGNEIKQIEKQKSSWERVFVASAKQNFENYAPSCSSIWRRKAQGRLALIQTVTKYLDAEELDIKKLEELSCGRAEGAQRMGDKG